MSAEARHLRVERINRPESIKGKWSDLAVSSRNIFSTWEWMSLWWRHFGHARELAVAGVYEDDDNLVAILPLYFWSAQPARVLRFLGHGVSDELGPICGPSDRPAAAGALARYLKISERRWDVFLAENLPSQEDWQGSLEATVLRKESYPVLHDDGGGGWAGFLASRSSNFRQQIGRRERNLYRRHDVRYRLADDPAQLQSDLDVLFALHSARWPNGKSAFGGARENFHRDFAALALEREWLRLWFLELDGQPAAAWYGFRFGATESYYQAGRDPTLDYASVGFVLLAHSIREAFLDGLTEYRFLRGDDGYKSRFASQNGTLDTLAVSSGARGRAVVAAARALRSSSRLRKALRAPLGA
jgi:CelD/BcsL family acetyltransferase involved in cellulose biosynthesis